MSSRIIMTLLFKFLVLCFAGALVRSDIINASLVSSKVSENVTYDCVDIYKQPSLNHPLLKTHKIQMKPSISNSVSEDDVGTKDQVGSKIYKKKIKCPHGTVPILRNTKEYILNAQRFEDIHLNPLSADSHGAHIAGVRSLTGGPYHGVQSWFNVFDLDIAKGQSSYAAIFIGSKTNFIQAGWMINPSVFGDKRVWTYGFWKGKDGKGCYNSNCPGFIQVAKDHPISFPNYPTPWSGWFRFHIHQDKQTGNWWITRLRKYKPSIDIGYWPKELFDLITDGAEIVGAGGIVTNSPSGLSPPMGNGKKPKERDYISSAIFTNVEVLDSNYKTQSIDFTPIDALQDSPQCYGLVVNRYDFNDQRYSFNYGGPGGNSCGI